MSEAEEKTKNIWKKLKEKEWRYLWTTALMAEYVALRLAPTRFRPDIMLAGLPIYHVQREGHAASDELIKYRSMGTIYLAHQKGGKRTFKCTLKIQGPTRLFVLAFLQRLQKTGVQENPTLTDTMGTTEVAEGERKVPFVSPTTNAKIRYIQGYEGIGKEQVAYHKTFPIITDTKVYTNMYLETLRYVEDIKIGVETMEIDCAFREFIPPMHVLWYKGNKEKNQKGYFTTYMTDDERDALRRRDLVLNIAWGMKTLFSETVNLEQKQVGQYVIESLVLATGAMLAAANIWGK